MSADRVGPWLLERPLGRGGMGEVWLARHATLGVPVALKVLGRAASQSDGLLAAWELELEAQARMRHRGVVSLIERGRLTPEEATASAEWETAAPWAALEWVDGTTLASGSGKLPWTSLRALLLRLLDALAHCHARGVVHRDLKAANVLVDERGWPRLTDFGLAHLCDRIPQEAVRGVPAGTPGYMSPEQFRGRWRDFGPWTDLYGLGCLVWRLVSGTPPFVAADYRTVARLHLEQDPPRLEPVLPMPAGLEDWLWWLLRKEPASRPQSAAEAALRLARLSIDGERRPEASGSGPCLRRLLVGSALRPGGHRASGGRHRHEGPDRGLGASLVGLAEPPLVMRPTLMDALWDDLLTVLDEGRPAVRVLRGPEGVGKSRLADWLCRRAAELGVAERWWSALGERVDGRALWLQGLRGWELDAQTLTGRLQARIGPDAERSAMSSLCRWIGGEALHGLDEEDARRLEAATLAALSKRHPLIVVLDGVDHAPERVELAIALLERVDARVLVVVTTTGTVDTRGLPVTDVPALPEQDLRALVRSLAGLDSRLVDEVSASAAGNPMVATQLVAAWARQRRLESGTGGLRLDADGPLIPGSLAMTWRRRVEGVLRPWPGEAAQLCECLALSGQMVEPALWEALSSPVAEAESLLTGLCDEGLLLRRSDGRLGWAHDLVREALAQRAERRGRRRQHHRWLAVWWEERGGAQLDVLGHHWLLAGDGERAAPLLLAAVGQLAEQGALHRARRALDGWVAAMNAAGRTAADAAWVPGRCWGVRLARQHGDVREVRQRLERLEAHAGGLEAQVEVRRTLAWLLVREGAVRQAVLELEELLDGEPRLRARLLTEMAWELGGLLRGLGRLDEALVRVDQARGYAAADGDVRWFQRCALARAELLVVRGELGEAAGQVERVRLDLRAQPESLLRARLYRVEGDLAHGRGNTSAAEAAWQEALAGLQAHGVPDATEVRWRLVALELERGRPDRALEGAATVQAEGRLARRPVDVARGALLEAAAQANRRRWEDALAALGRAREGLSRTGAAEPCAAWVTQCLLRSALRGGPVELVRASGTLLLELGIALGSERWVQEGSRGLHESGSEVVEALASV